VATLAQAESELKGLIRNQLLLEEDIQVICWCISLQYLALLLSSQARSKEKESRRVSDMCMPPGGKKIVPLAHQNNILSNFDKKE